MHILNMRIAIVDPRIHAPGLVGVFPEADYFVISYRGHYDGDKTPERFFNTYGFRYREDIQTINGTNYDVLIIIYAVHDFVEKHREDVQYHLQKLMEIRNSTYKRVICISNDDCTRDSSTECDYLNADVWFKRNVQSNQNYTEKVIPFPFVIFGQICPLWRVHNRSYIVDESQKIDRVLWAGYMGNDSPSRSKEYLGRDVLMTSSMRPYITVMSLSNDQYLQEIARSKFVLDMNGNGDPNIRTFEVLCTNTLLLQQEKFLVWPFEEEWAEETIYKTPEEFIEKLERLRSDPSLYKKCIDRQGHIKRKYFSKEWIRNYILQNSKLI